jgi:TonB family protein
MAEYTSTMQRRGEQGHVVIQAQVSAAGMVASAQVKQSSGNPDVDAAALAAMRQVRFALTQPGTGCLVEAPFNFRVADE